MANMIGAIFGLTFGVIVLANVFMPTVKGTNTSTWTTAEIALWGVLGLTGVMGIAYGVAAAFGIV
jgi:hypothetical protein